MAFSTASWPHVDRTVAAPKISTLGRQGPSFSEEVPEEVPESRQRRYQNSSSDGTRGGGDRAVAAHLEKRLSWVVKDPARLFATVESNVRSARERVGPLGFRVLQRVFARLARVVEQGSEYGPTDSRSTQPAWILMSERECWRWLSGDRILSDQPASMMSRIFGMCLDAYTFVKGRAAARRAAHAAPGYRVVMHAGYVGSELVGAEGVVEAVEEHGNKGGGRKGRWVKVAWTLAGGDVVREWLPISVLAGLGGRLSSKNRGSCDRCRTKARICKHQCQDMSLANNYAKSMPATLSASTMNLRSTRPTSTSLRPPARGWGRWNADEEAALGRLVAELGPRGNWLAISNRLDSGRSPGAVELHWQIMHGAAAKRPGKDPGTAAPRKRKSTGAAGPVDGEPAAGADGKQPPMKRARWGATHAIHEQFDDGYPELAERFVRQRATAAQRRYEYNLGSCRFPDAARADEGLRKLKTLFRQLDAACENADVFKRCGDERRAAFSVELAKWGWRRGARLQYRGGKDGDDGDGDGAPEPAAGAAAAGVLGPPAAGQLNLGDLAAPRAAPFPAPAKRAADGGADRAPPKKRKGAPAPAGGGRAAVLALREQQAAAAAASSALDAANDLMAADE